MKQNKKYFWLIFLILFLILYILLYSQNAQQNDNKYNSNLTNSNSNSMRIIGISDTHNMHEKLTNEINNLYQSENDILIHAGDMTEGNKEDLININNWFSKLKFKKSNIICVSGNMDGISLDGTLNGHKIFNNAIYLEHELYQLNINNKLINIFGSPWTLKFVGGFQIYNEKTSNNLWNKVPNNIDILITHGPPAGILDRTSSGIHTGDNSLYDNVFNRIKPKVHIFGHVHNSFGNKTIDNIQFVNVAQYDGLTMFGRSVKKPKPVIIDLKI